MIPVDTSMARQQIQDSHLNNDGLQQLREQGRNGDPQALREVARQFESMFVHQMLKQMRSTNEVFGKDNMFSSEQTKFHQEMLDQQMSLELTQGRGLGLAEMMYQQMQKAYGDHLKPEAGQALDATSVERTSGASTAEPIQTLGGKAAMTTNPAAFVAQIQDQAQRAAEALGVSPQALVAQAALETGWGQHVIHTREGQNSHNLFNIKADSRWEGARINVSTIEYRDGMPRVEQANFRQYDSYEESFSDYVSFLQDNPRYREALMSGADAEAYVEELQAAGYATDPAYADKLKTLMRTEPLASLEDGQPSTLNDA
ncbi:flagellar assembly peptidoglycan hydrolase FlgJ [Marinimicrobium agarilyticum]|uniref:flagellar assembly peptidoglycan hydrolase FlgJ n=1 Tax=Marinimicrobium agarilyticum TaxID=306546 RepID=UPI0004250E78|nr:flagellar assembly peptidoglycan hydrolase FlgJ [Marinimicrobium agarilyticum]